MQHTLSILMQNESGALARVVGLLTARHVNIDVLTVAPTQDRSVSHLTLVFEDSDAALEQLVRQTRKLIDVIEVNPLSLVGGRPRTVEP